MVRRLSAENVAVRDEGRYSDGIIHRIVRNVVSLDDV